MSIHLLIRTGHRRRVKLNLKRVLLGRQPKLFFRFLSFYFYYFCSVSKKKELKKKIPPMMIFLDLVDFLGLVWSFHLPKLCIKMLENEFSKWAPCFNYMSSVSWFPHECLHELWHLFTNELVMTLVNVWWGFELLKAIYQFSLIFSVMCDFSLTPFL